jgi:glycine/serine hydroxymethyltransferase
MTDADISSGMHKAFPGRGSAIFDSVSAVRSQFNKNPDDWSGAIEAVGCDVFTSTRYDENGHVVPHGKRTGNPDMTDPGYKKVKAQKVPKKLKKVKKSKKSKK